MNKPTYLLVQDIALELTTYALAVSLILAVIALAREVRVRRALERLIQMLLKHIGDLNKKPPPSTPIRDDARRSDDLGLP